MAAKDGVVIQTVEMHTGGEPLRIIKSGYPPLQGSTILEKRRYVRANLDHLRTSLMAEPRGHSDMYGALLVEKDLPEADLAVLFMHNEGYSTMCGHAVIALGRYAVDHGLVTPSSPETLVRIQCPCGLITAHTEYREGKTGAVWFESVPSFAFAVDKKIQVPGYGEIRYDIGYGGTFYALAEVKQFGLDLATTPVHQLVAAADALSTAVKASVTITHPDSPDLAFLYGTILTDGKNEFSEEPTANLCVFADCQVDRSPCGSGVMARTAVQFHKKQIQLGQKRMFVSGKVGSMFTGKPQRVIQYGDYQDAVIVEVGGRGHYLGEAKFWFEADDELSKGFLVK